MRRLTGERTETIPLLYSTGLRSAPRPRNERPQALDIVRVPAHKPRHRSLIHKPEPLRRSPDDPVTGRVKIGKPFRGDWHNGDTPEIEREGSGLAHARCCVTVNAVHAGRPCPGPRLAGRIGEPHHGSTTHADASGDITDVARSGPSRVLPLRIMAPNEIAGAVGVRTHPRRAYSSNAATISQRDR